MTKCNHCGTEVFGLDPHIVCDEKPERTYTESELVAERAALLREAAAYERGKQRDTAWLVERRDRGAIEYLNADGLGGDWDWTTDSIKAIHFCRRVDADKVGAIFDDLDIHICEHEWAALEDRGREAEK